MNVRLFSAGRARCGFALGQSLPVVFAFGLDFNPRWLALP
jgi:hypothetical protein